MSHVALGVHPIEQAQEKPGRLYREEPFSFKAIHPYPIRMVGILYRDSTPVLQFHERERVSSNTIEAPRSPSRPVMVTVRVARP